MKYALLLGLAVLSGCDDTAKKATDQAKQAQAAERLSERYTQIEVIKTIQTPGGGVFSVIGNPKNYMGGGLPCFLYEKEGESVLQCRSSY